MVKMAVFLSLFLIPYLCAEAPQQSRLRGQAFRADDKLSIGAATVRLGMSRDTTLSTLGSYFLLQRLPNATVATGLSANGAGASHIDEYWLISNKSNPDESFGEVGFGSGKLTWASKEWTHENKQYSGAETEEILYKIMTGFEENGATNCAVKTYSSPPASGPGAFELRQTRLNCGGRHVEINLIWQSGPGNIQVSEVVGAE